MTTQYKQLKQAAAHTRKLAAAVEAAEVAAQAKIAEQVKAASAQASKSVEQVKTAQAMDKAKITQASQAAAASIKKAGLLSSDEQAAKFASLIAGDHVVALTKLAELATRVPAPKLGHAVVSTEAQAPTADNLWDRRASQALNSMHGTK